MVARDPRDQAGAGGARAESSALSLPRVLGILNVTPDSFSDGGECFDDGGQLDARRAAARAVEMVEQGADAIDVGGESTRPGSLPVDEAEELRRVLPVLEALPDDFPVPISVDTRRARVAAEAADRGASWVNDTAALRDDPDLAGVIADRELHVVLMHRLGTPETMQKNPRYDDLIGEVSEFFAERVAWAERAGIPRHRILLDPGLGFGKQLEDNYKLMAALDRLHQDGTEFLVGASRKSFLGRFDQRPSAERREGSLAFVARAQLAGVAWVRVHDVLETVVFRDTLGALLDDTSVGGGFTRG